MTDDRKILTIVLPTDDLSFITGLMAANSDALGFIPAPTVEARYLAKGRYVIQRDQRGRKIGYVLHGAPTPGGLLTIAQAVIDYDFRESGQGRHAVEEVIARAVATNCHAIKLRCAEDLAANHFWAALGFKHVNTMFPNNRRQRAIRVYMMDLWPTLFG